jgi:DNA processing protein
MYQTEFDPGFAEPPMAFMPPPSDSSAERLARLRLIRSRRVGPATYLRLMAEHGSAAKALEALPEIARAAGVDSYSVCPEGVALAEMKAANRAGARMLCLGDADYPGPLADITDAPPILWAIGRQDLLQRPMLAIVGTRNASSLGARMARRLAADLGEAGFVVVSGLARGIDAMAHKAALDTGTIAVHAGGVDVIYPEENTALAQEIARTGLRLSEQPPGLDPQARHFPCRNRIVSGLAQAVIVVEAAARSGSLITARLALEQGREVLAVPGHPMDTRAAGGNLLIRDGAVLVRSADDVIEALGAMPMPRPLPLTAVQTAITPAPAPVQPVSRPDDGQGMAARIMDLIGPSPTPEDQVIRDLGISPAAMAQVLADLELEGVLERRPGGMLARMA